MSIIIRNKPGKVGLSDGAAYYYDIFSKQIQMFSDEQWKTAGERMNYIRQQKKTTPG